MKVLDKLAEVDNNIMRNETQINPEAMCLTMISHLQEKVLTMPELEVHWEKPAKAHEM